MDGKSKKFSGVINVEDIKNPICVAEKLLTYEDRVLSGKGAQDFARENGFDYYNPEIPQRRKEYDKKLSDSIRLGHCRLRSTGPVRKPCGSYIYRW